MCAALCLPFLYLVTKRIQDIWQQFVFLVVVHLVVITWILNFTKTSAIFISIPKVESTFFNF